MEITTLLLSRVQFAATMSGSPDLRTEVSRSKTDVSDISDWALRDILGLEWNASDLTDENLKQMRLT